ncbi:MAG: UMP kinase [Patescibacteria group bacterium]
MPPIVISIGGSIVVPKSGIDVAYLKALRGLIMQEAKKGRRFIVVVGGGSTARAYQQAANSVARLDSEDVDWLGIHATRLNGHLLRSIFRGAAAEHVAKDPTRRYVWTEPILIAAGWKPGRSTDYVAVRFARKYGARRILNLTNIDAVYDKDPARFEDAEPIERIAWKDFRKIVGDKWSPGANAPFDPIASKLAQKWGMEVVIALGKDLKNVKKIFEGKKFKGTLIDGE